MRPRWLLSGPARPAHAAARPAHAAARPAPPVRGRRVAVGLLAGVAVGVAGVAAPMGARPAEALVVPDSFTVTGAGFGHGVGLSQYGAYAQALAGRSPTQILTTYYPGTTVGARTDARDLKVGLGSARTYVGISACPVDGATAQPSLVVTAGGQDIPVPAGAAVGLAAVAPPAGRTGTWIEVRSNNQPLAAPVPVTATDPVTVRWSGTRYLAGPAAAAVLTNTPDCAGLAASSAPSSYRYGRLLAYSGPTSTASKPTFALVNELRLGGEYLDGIAEMPSSWGKPRADGSSGAAALAAQAIAARGYALRKLDALAGKPGGVNPDCRCHILPTTADQVFVGWKKAADPTYGRYWTAAVDATEHAGGTGDVVLYDGALASTNYYSSSGGRTENVWEVWNSSQTAYPYLRSVADPWSLDPAAGNPYRSWTRTYPQALVASVFGLPDVAALDLSARTTGDSLARAVATSSAGATASLSGATFRSRVNARAAAAQTLPSTWFRLDGAPAVRAVTRLEGATRWATAARVALAAYPGTAPSVVLASGVDDHLVDGLVAGPLARAARGPVLLVGTSVPAETASALTRLAPSTVYLVGGPRSIPAAVVDGVQALLPGVTVRRLEGSTRYVTAAAVAAQVAALTGGAGGATTGSTAGGTTTSLPDVVVAAGAQANLADALAVGGPAGAVGRPVLLTRRDELPDATRTALTRLGARRTLVVGGPVAVSDAVLTTLPDPQRAGGSTRYATAAAVAGAFPTVPDDVVVLAGGEDAHLVDSLPAGALGRRMLLTPAAVLAPEAGRWLTAQAPLADLTVVGGTDAVSAAAVQAAAVLEATG